MKWRMTDAEADAWAMHAVWMLIEVEIDCLSENEESTRQSHPDEKIAALRRFRALPPLSTGNSP